MNQELEIRPSFAYYIKALGFRIVLALVILAIGFYRFGWWFGIFFVLLVLGLVVAYFTLFKKSSIVVTDTGVEHTNWLGRAAKVPFSDISRVAIVGIKDFISPNTYSRVEIFRGESKAASASSVIWRTEDLQKLVDALQKKIPKAFPKEQ